jgi:hypothetical protein
MNCYDCAITGHHNPAVATCIDCGAGLCLDHAIVASHHLTHVGVINRVEIIEPPARLMYCHTCAAAHDAAAHHHAGRDARAW